MHQIFYCLQWYTGSERVNVKINPPLQSRYFRLVWDTEKNNLLIVMYIWYKWSIWDQSIREGILIQRIGQRTTKNMQQTFNVFISCCGCTKRNSKRLKYIEKTLEEWRWNSDGLVYLNNDKAKCKCGNDAPPPAMSTAFSFTTLLKSKYRH